MATDKSVYVRDMFAAIAHRYDSANRLMTAGVDEAWRRRAVRELRAPAGGTVLDVCCGTGDLAFGLARSQASLNVVAVDFCEPMLDEARRRKPRERGGERVRFELDGATMGFSLRNVLDVSAALREARRVLRPGARFVNLDVTRPANRFVRALFDLYFYRVVPFLGGLVGGSKSAYRYLPASLTNHPDADRLSGLFASAGFAEVRCVRLGGGGISLHVGTA